MPQNVAFHQVPHRLLRQKRSSETEIQQFYEIITCHPSIFIMDRPDLTVSNSIENSVGLVRFYAHIIHLVSGIIVVCLFINGHLTWAKGLSPHSFTCNIIMILESLFRLRLVLWKIKTKIR